MTFKIEVWTLEKQKRVDGGQKPSDCRWGWAVFGSEELEPCTWIHICTSLAPHIPILWASQVAPSGKEPACKCRRHNKRCGFDPWVRKSP